MRHHRRRSRVRFRLEHFSGKVRRTPNNGAGHGMSCPGSADVRQVQDCCQHVVGSISAFIWADFQFAPIPVTSARDAVRRKHAAQGRQQHGLRRLIEQMLPRQLGWNVHDGKRASGEFGAHPDQPLWRSGFWTRPLFWTSAWTCGVAAMRARVLIRHCSFRPISCRR